ncbi:MAG TPA: flavodoxin domain-containing protein [Ktedonobacterales bacterium]|nr:flavodoxin domain-containing protein [Ktedonobacterales bacterium]
MHALVVYDSQFGNTERIAAAIADTLRTTGEVRLAHVDPAHPLDLEGIDLLILGSPTQGWQSTKAMQALLAKLTPQQLHGRAVACFDTRFQKPRWITGSAARRMAASLRHMGVTLLAPPESFFVEGTEGPLLTGELGRAAVWARALLNRIETPHPVMQR